MPDEKLEPLNLQAVSARLLRMESALGRLKAAFPIALGELPVVFGLVNPVGFPQGAFPRPPRERIGDWNATRKDAIRIQRTRNCVTTVTVTSKYELKTRTETIEPAIVCNTYEILISVHVEETCDPGQSTVDKGTATHLTSKTWCDSATDMVKTGESTGFDGKKTDTLSYDNGTRIETEHVGEGLTVTVTWPDGTTTSLQLP